MDSLENTVALQLDIPKEECAPSKEELSHIEIGDWAKIQLSGATIWTEITLISEHFISGTMDRTPMYSEISGLEKGGQIMFQKSNIFKIRKKDGSR